MIDSTTKDMIFCVDGDIFYNFYWSVPQLLLLTLQLAQFLHYLSGMPQNNQNQ